jgi:hypothetical protein
MYNTENVYYLNHTTGLIYNSFTELDLIMKAKTPQLLYLNIYKASKNCANPVCQEHNIASLCNV